MQVKMIIVDELPEKCWECDACQGISPDYFYCMAKHIDVDAHSTRPDWCPLVVDECCEWVGVVIEKSEHSKTVEYKNPHMNIKSQIDYFNPNEFKYYFTCGKRIKYVEVE